MHPTSTTAKESEKAGIKSKVVPSPETLIGSLLMFAAYAGIYLALQLQRGGGGGMNKVLVFFKMLSTFKVEFA